MRELLLGTFFAVLLCSNAPAQVFARQQRDWVATWVFNGQTEAQFRKRVESDCQMRVKMIDRLCELDEPQRSKLALAGDADVTRFFRSVAKVRKEIDAMDLKGDNQDINKILVVVSPLQTQSTQGLFTSKSLFQRVTRSVLSEEQQALYAAELKKNRMRRWKAITRVNIAEIEKSMPILADQREKLLEMLDAQELPKTITIHMDGYAGFLKLAKAMKTNEKEFAEFLDPKQMKVVEQYCERYQGWAGN